MITKDEATITLRGLLPPNKKIFYQVTGEALQNGQVLWAFKFLLAKQSELIQVTPLIAAVLGYRSNDTDYLRIRDVSDLNKIMSSLQDMISRSLPEDGILLTDLAAALEVVEISLIGQGAVIPPIPALEIVQSDCDV